ncbi:MAG: gliding motility-associated C-terminal domain-containing protein [Bacteroidota bacterium]
MKIKDYFFVMAIVMACSLSSRAQITVLNDIKCNGATTGSLSATPGFGIPPYSYLWSNAATTPVISSLAAGGYSVTITDGTPSTIVYSIVLTQPPLLTVPINPPTEVSCFNGYDGLATVAPVGGTFPFSYVWSNGDHNASATGLSSGTYTVTVTDFNSCTATNTVTITQPPQLTSVVSSLNNLSCNGANNGSASITASGGTPGYFYAWSNGSSTNSIAGVAAGNYSVIVSDVNGCTVGNSIVISQPTPINLPVTNKVNVSCFGGNNGTATVIANGGVAPYTYLWSNGANTTTISNLTAGVYTLTVTDFTGCVKTTAINITQPAPVVVNTVQIIPSDCDGHNNGSASIAVVGGTSPYTYHWREIASDSVYTTQNISLVRGGNYEIIATDILGCVGVDTIIIPNLAVVPITVTVQSYICNGALGSVNMLADSADSAQYYTYHWSSTYNTSTWVSNDSVFGTGTSFLAGNYTITITENSTACAAYYNFTINQSATPMVVTSKVIHNNCFGDHHGSIQLFVNGGDPLPTYQATWTGPYGYVSSGFAIGSLVSGDYTYTVTDDGACSASNTIRIQPLLPVQGYTTKNDISCHGNTNGSISAFYSGGQGTLHYLWSNGATTTQINNLVAGTYTLTVTDSVGCSKSASVQILEPPALVTTLNNQQNVSCFGVSDGDIWTSTSGGSGLLEYQWLHDGSLFPEVTNNLLNIPAGIYHLTVTDSLMCHSTLDVTISQPTQTLFTDSVHVISCNNGADGYWNISPTGAYNPYIAIFSTFDTISTDTVPSPFIAGLAAGTYSCQITASNGCKWDFVKTFVQPLPITVGLTDIVPIVCYGDSTGSVKLDDVHGGTAPYTYLWSNTTTANPLVNVPAGTYHVTITDSKSCTIDETYIIEQPYEPIKFFATVTATSCQQSEDGQVVVYPNDIYWSPYNNMFILYDSINHLIDSASAGQVIGNLPPGPYTLVLINGVGCTARGNIYVDKGPDNCILIPNLVTANGDGYNDVFKVQGGCEYETFHVSIFTDLGKNVLESDDCNFIWDPKATEKASPNTVFYYYIKVSEGGKAWEFRNSINVNY